MSTFFKRTNIELEADLKNLVVKERKLLHLILEHIKEIEVRKIYLDRAYSSMYEYLVKELGYSGSAAMRRLEAARLLKEVPNVSEKIQEGSLNLSQIGELSKIIKEKERTSGEKVSCLQKLELVSKISGKTTLETQKELSLSLEIPIKEHEVQRAQKNDSVRLELTFSKEQYEKLMMCKDLSAHLIHRHHKDTSWAALIEVLADQYLKRTKNDSTKSKQSEKKNESRSKSERTKFSAHSDTGSDADNYQTVIDTQTELPNKSGLAIKSANAVDPLNMTSGEIDSGFTVAPIIQRINKCITSKTRRAILNRDLCCQYKDPITGKLCESTYGLQVDHQQPRWDHGDNSFSNLTTLCMRHNQHKYKKEANIRSL